MKRTRSHYNKASIPRKKLQADGTTWEDAMTTPRSVDLFDKLLDCLTRRPYHTRARAFLECLDEEKCTKEELGNVVELHVHHSGYDGGTLLHQATFSLRFDFGSDTETSLEVLRKMIESCATTVIFAPDAKGDTPLHILCCVVPPSIEPVKLLLNADPSRSTLFVKNGSGRLPLHMAELAISFREGLIDRSIVRLLYDCEHKKEILDTKDNDGETPLHSACIESNHSFWVMAQDRIQLVPGPPAFRKSLLDLLRKYSEWYGLVLVAKHYDNILMRPWLETGCKEFGDFFQDAIARYEELEECQGMTILQLAVWKGRGLTKKAKEREARWVTCGANIVAKKVSEFLITDAILLIWRLQIAIDGFQPWFRQRLNPNDTCRANLVAKNVSEGVFTAPHEFTVYDIQQWIWQQLNPNDGNDSSNVSG